MSRQIHSRGNLISLEGIEGAGKTTHLNFIKDFLLENGISSIVTREPGATPLGKEIRALLLSADYQIGTYAELSLLFADRADHIEKIIRPALVHGDWVISDRFVDASLAYQGAGRGASIQLIEMLTQTICEEIQPALTLLFDVDYEVAMERVSRRDKKDRFESEDVAFFTRVKQCYLELAQKNPQHWQVINANETLDSVQLSVKKALTQFLQSI